MLIMVNAGFEDRTKGFQQIVETNSEIKRSQRGEFFNNSEYPSLYRGLN